MHLHGLPTAAHPQEVALGDLPGGGQRWAKGRFQNSPEIFLAAIAPGAGTANGSSRRGRGDPETEFTEMQQSTFLTQEEAADVCRKSYDTIRRYRRQGRLPNSRTRADGTVEVAVADLVATGLLDALANTGDVTEAASRSRTERDLAAMRQELNVLRERNEGLLERLERADGEIAFLRSMLYRVEVA